MNAIYVKAHERMSQDRQFAIFGYEIFRGFKSDWKKYIKIPFSDYLLNKLKKYNCKYTINCIEDYHKAFEKNESDHHNFINEIKREVPSNIIKRNNSFLNNIISTASKMTGKEIRIYNNRIEFRVVRPNSFDNNKLHRDNWFPYFTPLINIYIPICGSYHSSVLKVVPESHLWKEEEVVPTFKYNEGKSLNENGILYSTPTIKSCTKKIVEHRPDVLEGDYMLFSPLMIHGGGNNLGTKTRFSLEIRLEIID